MGRVDEIFNNKKIQILLYSERHLLKRLGISIVKADWKEFDMFAKKYVYDTWKHRELKQIEATNTNNRSDIVDAIK